MLCLSGRNSVPVPSILIIIIIVVFGFNFTFYTTAPNKDLVTLGAFLNFSEFLFCLVDGRPLGTGQANGTGALVC